MTVILILFYACSVKQKDMISAKIPTHKKMNTIQNPVHTVKSKEGIFSLKQAKNIDLQDLVKEVEHYPVIFVGDHHDTEKTHTFFNDFLQSLANEGYKLHLANEWFRLDNNDLLKLYTDNIIGSDKLKEYRDWDNFTKHRWGLVAPLYESVKKSGGKLYGINISKKDRKKISLKMFAMMDSEEKSFYDNLDLNVPAHKSLVMPFFKNCDKMTHHHKNKSAESCQNRMYRVQVAWDTYMATQSAKLAKEVIKTKKDKLIVFAGSMHMEYGLGIPLRFARLCNLPSYVISNHKYQEKKETLINPHVANAVFLYKH